MSEKPYLNENPHEPINDAGGESREPQADERSSSPLQASSVNPSPASPPPAAAEPYYPGGPQPTTDHSCRVESPAAAEPETTTFRYENAGGRETVWIGERKFLPWDRSVFDPQADDEPEKPVAWMYENTWGQCETVPAKKRWAAHGSWTETPLYAAVRQEHDYCREFGCYMNHASTDAGDAPDAITILRAENERLRAAVQQPLKSAEVEK